MYKNDIQMYHKLPQFCHVNHMINACITSVFVMFIFYYEIALRVNLRKYTFQGRIQRGAHMAPPPPPPPLKLEKIWFFWRKIVIFHTKYPKNVRASLRNYKKIWLVGVKSWFFTRNTPKTFAPPSAITKKYDLLA